MNRKISIIAILVLLAASCLVLVFSFRDKMKLSATDTGQTVALKLQGDFERKWAANEAGAPIRSLAAGNGTVFYTGRGACAVDAATGAKLWETQPRALTPLAVGGGVLAYGAADKNLYVFDTATGQEKWHLQTVDSSSSPAISAGTVFYGTTAGDLYAFDAGSGAQKWHASVPGSIAYVGADGATVAAVVWDGKSHSDSVAVLDASSGAQRWPRRCRPSRFPPVPLRCSRRAVLSS